MRIWLVVQQILVSFFVFSLCGFCGLDRVLTELSVFLVFGGGCSGLLLRVLRSGVLSFCGCCGAGGVLCFFLCLFFFWLVVAVFVWCLVVCRAVCLGAAGGEPVLGLLAPLSVFSLLFSSAPVGVAVCALVCMVFLLGQLFADE